MTMWLTGRETWSAVNFSEPVAQSAGLAVLLPLPMPMPLLGFFPLPLPLPFPLPFPFPFDEFPPLVFEPVLPPSAVGVADAAADDACVGLAAPLHGGSP